MRSAMAPGVAVCRSAQQSVWLCVWNRHGDRSSGRFPIEDLYINRVLSLSHRVWSPRFFLLTIILHPILSSVVPSLLPTFFILPALSLSLFTLSSPSTLEKIKRHRLAVQYATTSPPLASQRTVLSSPSHLRVCIILIGAGLPCHTQPSPP